MSRTICWEVMWPGSGLDHPFTRVHGLLHQLAFFFPVLKKKTISKNVVAIFELRKYFLKRFEKLFCNFLKSVKKILLHLGPSLNLLLETNGLLVETIAVLFFEKSSFLIQYMLFFF